MSDELRRLREALDATLVYGSAPEAAKSTWETLEADGADPEFSHGVTELVGVWPELLAVVDAAREVVETAKPDPETWPARRKLCWMIDDLDAAINRSLDGAR